MTGSGAVADLVDRPMVVRSGIPWLPRVVGHAAVTSAIFAASPAFAELPAPRLLPELSFSKDKGVDSAADPDPWSTRKKTVSLQGGAPGGPLGAVGLSFEYAPIKYVVLGTGGGWAPEGPRAAVFPRFRLPLNRWFAVGLGVPFSFGPYQFSETLTEQCAYVGCAVGYRTTRTWSMAAWGHLEPNVEFRISSAVALRLYGGYARLLNDSSDRCDSTLPGGCPSTIGAQKYYGGAAVGYAW